MLQAFMPSICKCQHNYYLHWFFNSQKFQFTMRHNAVMMNNLAQDTNFKQSHQKASNYFESEKNISALLNCLLRNGCCLNLTLLFNQRKRSWSSSSVVIFLNACMQTRLKQNGINFFYYLMIHDTIRIKKILQNKIIDTTFFKI